MLTVDYDRLGVRAGERLLDLGCGAGRHAFEAVKRGADVVALDADGSEIKHVALMFDELASEARRSGLRPKPLSERGVFRGSELDGGTGATVQGDAFHLPFPDGAFDRVIAAEVLEHLPADRSAIAELTRVLRPGGTMAVTVPRWFPELVNWALSDDYHTVEGGHVRIYRRSALEDRLREAGLRITGADHAHALHSPYWWLKCAVGVRNDDHPLVKAYHRLLVWDIVSAPPLTRIADRILNPVIGKSLVLYTEKPAAC